MKHLLLLLVCLLAACQHDTTELEVQEKFLVNEVPESSPIVFMPELVPQGKLIHKGIFSPDFQQYYYTLSNQDFTNFEVMTIRKIEKEWATPTAAFFNSVYDDHGMSFSPDGNFLYFSSTRPVDNDSIPNTWHIWRCENINGQWSTPTFVDIPNLRDKLVSHPTVTNTGTMYFHASELDYSNMSIYSAKQLNGQFQPAQQLPISTQNEVLTCTPFIAADESYLLFAQQENNHLNLMISYKNANVWSPPKALDPHINSNGQGNPYLSPDGAFLFFTVNDSPDGNEALQWNVKWVNTANFLN